MIFTTVYLIHENKSEILISSQTFSHLRVLNERNSNLL